MSFMSVLQKVGHDIAVVFEKAIPIAKEVQIVAAPIEAAFNPALPALINMGLAGISSMEATAAAAGSQTGSGPVKLAAVIASLSQSLGPTLISLGVDPAKVTSAQYTNFVNGLVQAANAFETTQESTTSANVPVTITSAPVTGAAVSGK
jgi:hypothetical protein